MARVPRPLPLVGLSLLLAIATPREAVLAAEALEPRQTLASGGGLDAGPSVSVDVSPDGLHVYGTGVVRLFPSPSEHSLSAFARDAASGELTTIETLLVGPKQLADVAVSGDGQNVYAVDFDGNTVETYQRDVVTGRLTLIQSVGGIGNSLAGAHAVTLSPDGAHAYVAASHFAPVNDSVTVFERDPADGTLLPVDVESDGVGGVTRLAQPRDVAVSPDGAHVYVPARDDLGVTVFARDPVTGGLTLVETELALRPVFAAVSPDGAHVYVVDGDFLDIFEGDLRIYSRDPVGGQLAPLASVGGLRIGDIAFSPDGQQLYVGHHVFQRNPATGLVTLVETVPGLAYERYVDVASSPDAAHVYATGAVPPAFQGHSPDGVLAGFARDPGTGALTLIDMLRARTDGVALALATFPLLSPDGAHAYVASARDDSVVTFARNAATGLLTFVESIQDGRRGLDGLDAANAIAVSGNGAHLYVSAAGDHAVTVFDRDAVSGQLTFVESERDGVGGTAGLEGATAVALSAGGEHVYVVGAASVAAFGRDAVDGRLTFLEAELDGVGGVDGLDGAAAVVVTPDGSHVYTAAVDDAAIARFRRDPVTGLLTFEEASVGTFVTGGFSFSPSALAVSTDGALLYVAYDGALAVFARDLGTGALTLVQRDYRVTFFGETPSPTGHFDDLGSRPSVALSPDGRTLYVAGDSRGRTSMVSFERDSGTGVVTHAGSMTPGPTRDFGRHTHGLAVSPSSRHVYTTVGDFDTDAVVLLERAGCPATPRPDCRRPTAPVATLVIRQGATDAKDKLQWKWNRGEATAVGDFADPSDSADYALCLYDASPAAQPRLASLAPAGGNCFGTHPNVPTPCWVEDTARGRFRYRDRSLLVGSTPDGIVEVDLFSGVAGRAQLRAKSGGALLGLPPLPLTPPVDVQVLHLESGVCWGATHSAPSANTATKFSARGG